MAINGQAVFVIGATVHPIIDCSGACL